MTYRHWSQIKKAEKKRVKKISRKQKIIHMALLIILVTMFYGYFEYKNFYSIPTSRLALNEFYQEMPPDEYHHYINLPIDHNDHDKGNFRGFYILSPDINKQDEIVFLLTDGQMQLVDTNPDFGFFEKVVGNISYVLIGRRGYPPTLLPEVFSKDDTLDYKTAMNLYGSDQHVEDIEQVRLDLIKKGYLSVGRKIMIFGASGAGFLAQQYLSKYGDRVKRAIIAASGAPDISRNKKWSYSHNFVNFNPAGNDLLLTLLESQDFNLPALSLILFQIGRKSVNPREAQIKILNDLLNGGNLYSYCSKPQYNLFLMQQLMKAPSVAAVKVRMYELLGYDLGKYNSQKEKDINLLYEFAHTMLSDFVEQKIEVKDFSINRSQFNGEVLVVCGTDDVVFSTEISEEISKLYPNSKLVVFKSGHSSQGDTRYYMELRKNFLSFVCFDSPIFKKLYHDPLNINGKIQAQLNHIYLSQ